MKTLYEKGDILKYNSRIDEKIAFGLWPSTSKEVESPLAHIEPEDIIVLLEPIKKTTKLKCREEYTKILHKNTVGFIMTNWINIHHYFTKAE